MLPYQMIAGGYFNVSVTGGVASSVSVSCKSQAPPDFIVCRAMGNGLPGTTQDFTKGWGGVTAAQSIEWWWEKSMPNYTAKGMLQTSATPAPAMQSYTLAANGIYVYNTYSPPTFAALAATAITGSTGAFVVSMANTGSISVGDYVRIYSSTAELQIAGYSFQVTAVTTNTSITLGYMASSGITFAADATAAQVVKYYPNRDYPRWRYIANITTAAQATVYFTEQNDFTPGEIVSFRVSPIVSNPAQTTMLQMNNVQARVLSVTNSATVSSIVIDWNTSGYTAFAFPTSAVAAAGGSNPAVCVPSSSGVVPNNGNASSAQPPPGTNLQDSFDDRNTQQIVFGSGLFNVSGYVSTENDLWMWQAYLYDSYNSQ